MAHLSVVFPEDAYVWAINDAFMFGGELLVAPVVTEAATTREVYLPHGQWRDFFSGEAYEGEQTIHVSCPLDRIPAFWRS